MAKFTLEINCDNAAFEDDLTPELALLIYKTAETIAQFNLLSDDIQEVSKRIYDTNGNAVGHWKFEK